MNEGGGLDPLGQASQRQITSIYDIRSLFNTSFPHPSPFLACLVDAPSVWHKALAMTFSRTSPALGGSTRIVSVTNGLFGSHATACMVCKCAA